MPTELEQLRLKAHLEATLVGKLVRIHCTERDENSLVLIVASVYKVEGNQVFLEAAGGVRYYYFIDPEVRNGNQPYNWHLEIYGEECPYAD